MSFAYIKKLSLMTWKTNVRAQKINSSILEIFGIVVTDFYMEYKGGKLRFF